MTPPPQGNRPSQRTKATADHGLGRAGEEMAARYLESKGMQILHRNWRPPHSRHEIDIIALDGTCVAFVEVKSARSRSFGDPVTWVTPQKREAITRAANAFIGGWTRLGNEFRFDIVTVGPPGPDGLFPIRHIPQAFML